MNQERNTPKTDKRVKTQLGLVHTYLLLFLIFFVAILYKDHVYTNTTREEYTNTHSFIALYVLITINKLQNRCYCKSDF